MPKQQSSIDSFFGVQGVAKKKQKPLTSFFKKENVTTKKEKDDKIQAVVEEDADEGPVLIRKKEKTVDTNKTRKRKAIVDDDSEDDEFGKSNIDNDENEKKKSKSTKNSSMDVDDDGSKKTNHGKTSDVTPSTAATTTESKTEVSSSKQNSATTKKIKPGEKQTATKETKKMASLFVKNDAKITKQTEKAKASSSNIDSTDTPETNDNEESDCPHRKKMTAQAKKLAKAAKVDWEVDDIDAPISYKDLVAALEQIEAISGRLEIQSILTKLIRRVLKSSPKDLYHVVYLASNSIAPAYECVELGIGDSVLIKAIGEAYGTKPASVKQKYETEGDLGSVAMSCKSHQRTLSFGMKPKPLLASQVLEGFRDIAKITGSQSQKLKVDKIKKLLVRVQDPTETKFIIRGLQGKLRIGLAQSTVLVSLAHALSFTVPGTVDCSQQEDEESENENAKLFKDDSAPVEKRLEAAAQIVKQAYSEVPSYDALLDAALSVPLPLLKKACSFQPGIPVAPMLAKPTKSVQEVLKRLNGTAFTCEFKYDGERAQIHKTADGTLKVFSRNLLETSSKYPEVPLFVQEAATDSVASFVIDAEVVAYNPKTGQLVPFQVLSTRKKTEESAETAKVQVIVQAFDLMYLNGESLLNKKMSERKALLSKHFLPVEGKFQYAKSLDFVEDGDTTALEQFLDLAVKGQCEGLMVKTMNDVYEPSRRSLNWLKLKKDYLEGLGDSFDLVPLGAYYGKGKRTGVYGAYLLACYDEDSEEFQSVCKIGTGFSDEDLQTLSKALNEHKIDGKSSQYNVADGLECDVWFDAVQVWEIKAADLSKSSLHRGAVGKTGEAGRGIGLRFPRFERIRDDKKPEQATTSDQILDFYYNQDTVKGQDDGGDDDDGI